MNNGKIIVITAPSGSGKTTLVRRLLDSCGDVAFSISACTRQPRPNEVHGRDYYFYTEAEFKNLVAQGAFVEWEMVYPGKYYGTLKAEVERIWQDGRAPLVDIDVKGALSIQEQYPEQTLSIFIKAPSLDELRRRLRHRGTETEHTLHERVTKAAWELTFAPRFDKILVNDDLGLATTALRRLVTDFLAS